MDSSLEKDKISADPFAGDIFADARAKDIPQNETPPPQNTEPPSVWSKRLRKASLSKKAWTNLHRNLPLEFIDELPRALIASLSQLINVENKTVGDLLFINEREINRHEEIPIINPDSWWVTAAIENSSAEVYLEIGNVFAGWLVDAILNENFAGKLSIRQLTQSEAAVLEFTALQLTHDANQILQSPLFNFRPLRHQIPASLGKAFEAESPSLLIADWQIVYDKQTSLVKIYVLPEALEALQPGENILLDSARHRASGSRYQTSAENLRMRINFGQAELTFAELAALEKNDVVLLEKLSFFLRNGNLSGQAEVFLGDAENTKVSGRLISPPARQPGNTGENIQGNDHRVLVRQLNSISNWQISIAEISQMEIPKLFEEDMAEEDKNTTETGEEPSAEPTEKGLAIENIGVTLRVELEARRLNLEEAANLRINQVIDLGVSPTDSVNLLINDKLVGRGEIVEVENRLGVRIIKLIH